MFLINFRKRPVLKREDIKKAVEKIIEQRLKRNFIETFELQFCLFHKESEGDFRRTGFTHLPSTAAPNKTVLSLFNL